MLLPLALLYLLHYVIFRDVRDVAFYVVMDLAFLPIQAILVSSLLEAFLSRHEASSRTEKLGMVSGAFFSEVGDGLLLRLMYLAVLKFVFPNSNSHRDYYVSIGRELH